MAPNYRLVAIQIGDLVKWNSSVNEINRAASAILRIAKDSYPNEINHFGQSPSCS
jgi:hypothetical protein